MTRSRNHPRARDHTLAPPDLVTPLVNSLDFSADTSTHHCWARTFAHPFLLASARAHPGCCHLHRDENRLGCGILKCPDQESICRCFHTPGNGDLECMLSPPILRANRPPRALSACTGKLHYLWCATNCLCVIIFTKHLPNDLKRFPIKPFIVHPTWILSEQSFLKEISSVLPLIAGKGDLSCWLVG